MLAREFLSGWAEAQPLKQSTLGNIADIFYKDIICCIGTLECVAVNRGAQHHE
jgi:hypothetical protein